MRERKERVIAFRIPDETGDELDKSAETTPVPGVRSGNQLARKLVLDFVHGKLIYLNPIDRLNDPSLAES